MNIKIIIPNNIDFNKNKLEYTLFYHQLNGIKILFLKKVPV